MQPRRKLLLRLMSMLCCVFGSMPVCPQESQALPLHLEGLRSVREAKGVNEGTVGIVFHYEDLYRRLTNDMKAVLDRGNEIRLVQVIGDNHVQSVYDMLYLRGIDLGIVHSDVLEFVTRTQSYPAAKRHIRYVTKLFDEKVALIANSSYSSIKDLEGRRVNLSKPGGGRHITGTLLFDILGIEVEPLQLDKKVALEKVKSGEIAAMVYLIEGVPFAPEFQNLTLGDGVTLLTIPNVQKLLEIYRPTELTHEEFPNLISEGAPLPSISLGVMLASYNWPPDSWRHEKVARFLNAFVSKFDQFRDPERHYAWQKVDLLDDVRGWSRLPIMETWVRQERASMMAEEAHGAEEVVRVRDQGAATPAGAVARAAGPHQAPAGFVDPRHQRQQGQLRRQLSEIPASMSTTEPVVGGTPTTADDKGSAEPRAQSGAFPPGVPPGGKIVFVTSDTVPADVGGLVGADGKCNALAQAAGLPGRYVAWLSDSWTNAKDRLTPGSGPFVRVDGVEIAKDIPDLLDGAIANPICITETGTFLEPIVWTGTDSSGSRVHRFTCADWAMNSSSANAVCGAAGRSDYAWTDVQRRNIDCSSGMDPPAGVGLYCFQR